MTTEGLAYLFFLNQERAHSALKDAIQKAGQGAGLGSLPGVDGKRPPERQERAHGRAPGPRTDLSMIDAGDIQTRARWAIEKRPARSKRNDEAWKLSPMHEEGHPSRWMTDADEIQTRARRAIEKKAGTIKEELHKNDEASFSKLSNEREKKEIDRD